MARRSRSKSRRASKEGRKKILGISLIGLVALVLAGLHFLKEPPPELDEKGCLINKASPKLLAILIDSTDEISERVARKAAIEILKEIGSLADYSMVDLYQISQDGNHITPLYRHCRPPTGKNADELTQNRRLLKARFEEFQTILNTTLHSLLDQKPANQSPIIESLQSVAIEMAAVDSNSHRILVVSDLIQHSSRLSFYRSRPSIDSYEEILRQVGGGFADLRGTEMRFMIIPRKVPTGDKSDLRDFWMDWIDRSGVKKSSSSIEVLQ